ncbi:MAG: glutamate--tRNA ligase [Planctomycetia bacterium]|nr:glutamate--tRNA ligase [Planctomycetia bacterium]
MIRTRFAPSPTGYLHIGGVRTALFCRLFAKHEGGRFILRIDDTDKERNVEDALNPILHGLQWLGITWDEGPEVGGPFAPYYQSERNAFYQEAVDALLASGFAYKDYARPEELAAERDAFNAAKTAGAYTYSRTWMGDTPEKQAEFEAQGRVAVVRLKMPREGKLEFNDLVRGNVVFDWRQEQDHVIQRADGSFIYHLANVVDDHAFEISHVIRAEEHLSNTPRQIFIIDALGWERPQYAHLPFVAEPGSHTKLSKRKLEKYMKNRDFAKIVDHGMSVASRLGCEVKLETFNPVVTDFFEQVGYLPEAIINYLALLGWSLDDKTEEFTPDELVELFSLERVNKAPASFDPAKLMSFQERAMQKLSLDEKYSGTLPFILRGKMIPGIEKEEDISDALRDKICALLKAAGDRIKVFGDILDYPDFFASHEALAYDSAAVEKRLKKPGAIELLEKFAKKLADVDCWTAGEVEEVMRLFLEEEQIKVGEIIHALRVASTGKSVGIGVFETLEILGKEETEKRIQRALCLAR